MAVLLPPKDKIKRISQRATYVKALIYGEPGAGKTYLACTAPDVLVLLTEPAVSDMTMLAVNRDLGIDPAVWDISTDEDLQEAFDYLASGDHGFKTVVVDSLTDLNRRMMRRVIDAAVRKRPTHDPDVPEQGDWFKVQERMRYIIRMFRDLPMNVVFTTLAMDVREEMKTLPMVQPKSLAYEIPAYFNLVGYLSVDRSSGVHVRKLLVEPTEVFVAKNPGGCLPPIVENPNLGEIFNKILKGDDLNAEASA